MKTDAIAAHEAGHAIVAWYSGIVKSVTHVTVSTRSGTTHLTIPPRKLLSPTDEYWADLVISLAGIAGQFQRGHSLYGPNAAADLLAAREMARVIALRYDAVESALPVSTEGRDTISRMYTEPPSAAERHVLESGYLKARFLLSVYRPEHWSVTTWLLSRGSMTEHELASLLGPRPAARPFLVRRRLQVFAWWRVAFRFARLYLSILYSRLRQPKGLS